MYQSAEPGGGLRLAAARRNRQSEPFRTLGRGGVGESGAEGQRLPPAGYREAAAMGAPGGREKQGSGSVVRRDIARIRRVGGGRRSSGASACARTALVTGFAGSGSGCLPVTTYIPDVAR